MKKKKNKKTKIERISRALKKAGFGILELKINPELVVNNSETINLTIFEVSKHC
ncbi:MAG: hypothetical protein ABGX26_02680 [Nautiliaceae bacterium]